MQTNDPLDNDTLRDRVTNEVLAKLRGDDLKAADARQEAGATRPNMYRAPEREMYPEEKRDYELKHAQPVRLVSIDVSFWNVLAIVFDVVLALVLIALPLAIVAYFVLV